MTTSEIPDRTEPSLSTTPAQSVRPRVRIQTEPPLNGTAPAPARERQREVQREAVFDVRNLSAYYGGEVPAVAGISMKMYRRLITALIRPAGYGKSTLIPSLRP